MEGPTPVSALIHAATMVTAGVYLIARTSPLFELAPDISDLAAILGGVTIVVAGLIALVQTDIKRVIAYSTMSQIGYMFVAVGLGAYGAGMFHLMTHAFFKALLFMAAGIVIHALSGEQDIRDMGGLGRELPWTARFFLIGALALAAIPPFAGFFSKDAILASAANAGTLGWILWSLGAVGAFLTALYTFRLVFIVFGGQMSEYARATCTGGSTRGPRDDVARRAPGRSLGGRRLPAGAGALGPDRPLARARGGVDRGGVGRHRGSVRRRRAHPLGCGDRARLAAVRATEPRPAPAAPSAMPWAARSLEHKLYFDEAYNVVFYEPSSRPASGLLRFVEQPIFLASLGGIGTTVRVVSGRVAAAQTGVVRLYVLAVAVGLAAMTVAFLIAT